MRKLILNTALVLALAVSFTSCRETKEEAKGAADAVEKAAGEAADAIGDAADATGEARNRYPGVRDSLLDGGQGFRLKTARS